VIADSVKHKYCGIAVLVFLLLIVSGKLACQEYPLREYGVRDGLPQSQANAIFQDSRDFIWIITRNGLSRFDGIEFVNYFRQHGLPSNNVLQVSEDRNGDIWVLASEGLSKYTGTGFQFYQARNLAGSVTDFVHMAPTEFPGKFLVVGTNRKYPVNRLYLFDNGTYSDYSSGFAALDTLNFGNIVYDTINSELVILETYLKHYSWKNKKLTRIPTRGFFTQPDYREGIFLRSNDTTLIYSDGRISEFILGRKPGKAEATLITKPEGSRIMYFDGSKIVTVKPPIYPSGPFVDNQGTLWMPSDRNLFRLLSTSFTTISDDLLKQRNLWAICADKNQVIWIGTLEGNLFRYDGTKFRELDEHRKIFTRDVAFFKGSRLLSNGEMWLSLNCGVLIWDGNKFRKLEGIPEDAQVCTIYEDPDDHMVFIGTQHGVFKTDGRKIECFPRFNEADLGVVEGIVKDDSGFYWMSGHRGLVRFDGVNAVDVNDPVLPEAFTFTIEKDSRGGIWVSSDEGLFFKKKGEQFFRHGLPADLNKPANVVKIIDGSHLLAGRGADICIIDLQRFYSDEKDYYRIYDKTDGFPGGDCLDNGIIKYKDGFFLILTSDGIVRLDPGAMSLNTHPPVTRFTGLYYQTDSLSWEPVRANEFYFRSPADIVLSRDQNKVKITFTGISTRNPEKVKYVHMLEGFEKKWSLPSGEREIVYDNLHHGQYRFLLKAENADGVENPEPVVLKFRIQPSFSETRFFAIGLVLFLVIATVLLTRFIIKRNQRIREEKQTVTTELIKMQIGAVLKELDPHFTFNAISSIGYLIMKGERTEAYTYLTRLSSLLRTILYDGSTISRTLYEELDFVKNYCELQKLRFEGKFTYNITIPENADTQREVPKMAIQIFVENSLKHGFESDRKGGIIDIIISQNDHLTEIIVRDNGIGRAASLKMNTPGTGHGIRTVKKIFEIMNHYNTEKATVEIEDLTNDEKPSGTQVVLRIPANYNFTTGKQLSV
jgi:hypothetical protein